MAETRQVLNPEDKKFYRQFGRGFKPEQFKRRHLVGINFDLPIYQVTDEIPRLIYDYARDYLLDETSEIFQGDRVRVGQGKIAFSNYANPCLVILMRLHDGDYSLMHAQGSGFSHQEKAILEQSVGGLAGGGMMWFEEEKATLDKAKIVPVLPEADEYDFVLTVIRRPIVSSPLYKTPRGIYYAYHKYDRGFPRNFNDLYET